MLFRTVCLIFICFGSIGCSPLLHTLHEKNTNKQRQYRAMVIIKDHAELEGVLYAVDSLGITLKQKSQNVYIPIKNIWEIRVRRKGNVSKGIGIGFAVGTGLGAAIGFGSELYEPKNIGESLVAGQINTISAGATTVAFGMLGGIFGGIVGTGNPYKFYIRGNPVNYRNYYKDLLMLSFERELEQ